MAVTVEQNLASMRRAYEAFSAGDMETLRRLWADDVVWHVGGRNRLSGDKRGPDAIIAYFGELMAATGNTLRVELHDAVGNDDHVVSVYTITGQKGGTEPAVSLRAVLVAHMRDGRFAEIWDQMDDTRTMDDLLA